MKIRKNLIYTIISIFSCVIIMTVAWQPIQASAKENTYYVDSKNGNDNNDGKSPNTPWKSLAKVNETEFKPGEKILLKVGSVWNGESLHPKGSGQSGSPIVIDKYGDSKSNEKPMLNGCGFIENVIQLYNQEYWEINNLEISNFSKGDNSLKDAPNRIAVKINGSDYGTMHHIHLKNLYIHDVNGTLNNKLNGGIMIFAGGDKIPTNYDDVLIEGCNFERVDRSGIKAVAAGIWCNRDEKTTKHKWYPSKNVIIRGNKLNDIGGDGITTRDTDGALIEHNVVTNSNMRCYKVNAKWNVAIWTFQADNTVIQYNEAAYTRSIYDGQGFDCDYLCNNTLMQYNYSHDNEGGFMLIMNNQNYNNHPVIRYNISQNDGTRTFQFNTGVAKDIEIYNNTIYTDKNVRPQIFNQGSKGIVNKYNVYNNLFYITKGTLGNVLFAGNFDRNAYFGEINKINSDKNAITSDPKLFSVGSGLNGIDTLDGYKLTKNSPLIGKGLLKNKEIKRDFFGEKINSDSNVTDIGASVFVK